MKLATLLVIAVSNQGYWFGGEPATIACRPAVKDLPGADLIWELRLDGIALSQGTAAVPGDDKEAVIHLTPPKVRARVTFNWFYRVVERNTKKVFETGKIPLSVFPDDLLEGLARRLGRKRLVICDKPRGLARALESAAIPCTEVALDKLEFARADDIVLVGPDLLTDSPFEQGPLMNLAEAGASVIVFRQSEPGLLFGFPLMNRVAPAHPDTIEWRMDHPLLAGFEPQDLRSWIAGVSLLEVIQLPPDEPALEVGFYPREVAGDEPAPIDALLVSKSVGKGRIVLCQLPLGDWKKDPRTRMLLRNAIDYLLTRPQPTSRPSERAVARQKESLRSPTVLITPGR